MKSPIAIFLSCAAFVGVATVAHGASPILLPLQFRMEITDHNFQSTNGVPLSSITNVPPGSNGRAPTFDQQQTNGLTTLPPTPNQFSGMISFGAIPGLTLTNWLEVSNNAALWAGTNAFNGTVASEMGLPVGRVNSGEPFSEVALILSQARVGGPYLSRQLSHDFGELVSVPSTDERGIQLTNVSAQAYWEPEPFSSNNHTNAPYYWSPHAEKVYTIQSGPIAITWRKTVPYTVADMPTDYTNVNGTASFATNGASVFLLHTARYVVSGSPVKPPRRIYWTERGFARTGKPVQVPPGRVSAVNIVYNNAFPRTVPTEYAGIGGKSRTDPGTNTSTLYVDNGFIRAYNQEGRVFIELLGDTKADNVTRVQLGTEIVDVFRQVNPTDVSAELGERIAPPSPGSLAELFPEPINSGGTVPFAYRHSVEGAERAELYGTRATANLNDYLIHWLEEGEAGLRWPRHYGRYRIAWPSDVGRYSHYLRPLVATEDEAKETAVPLTAEDVPFLEYQDPLDRPRAKLTPEYEFYTFLEPDHPAHRSLLRFISGDHVAFERVFSWLSPNLLEPGNFAGNPILSQLSAWNPTNQTLTWPDELTAPRIVTQDVDVGQRISAPTQEPGSEAGQDYLAGHLNLAAGTLYDVNAYVDPFAGGFEAANLGAIIPVNAIPGTNLLEVWWFRTNAAHVGFNAGDAMKGFDPIYWPSVIGRYSPQWPSNPREIVLASLLGGTGLSSDEAGGTIYVQNNPGAHGYNPNEEHAIMAGGTPFATRDDLNIVTSTNGEYSSHPFVLVAYEANDGRPDITPFKVLREKPEEGHVFDYIVPAGQLLQPPMPLPLLAKPVEGSGDNATNYNNEPFGDAGDRPVGWTSGDETGSYSNYFRFTYRDRHEDFWVYRGLHAGLPALQAGRYVTTDNSFVPVTNATAVVNQSFQFFVHVSRQDEYLDLVVNNAPGWLVRNGFSVEGIPGTNDVGTSNVQLVVRDLYDHSSVTNNLTVTVLASGSVINQPALQISSTNPFTSSVIAYTSRPPFLANSPTPSNSFAMQFYYKTDASFAWPGMVTPLPAGSVVPYLRPLTNDIGGDRFVGAADSKTGALPIVYRPVWPVRDPKNSANPLPTLPFGATLTRPAFELPGVRDFKTAHILYQQSIAANITNAHVSAVLHDPTRQKFSDLQASSLDELPAGVKAEFYQGRFYFPNLPPHLATLLFLDPNRGAKGSLVMQGEFKQELLGENYLLLNVLRGSDLDAAYALCPSGDPDSTKWTNAIDALTADVETFYEDPSQPGTYIANPTLTVQAGVGDLVEISNDNIPRDSYALSATGPGSGYVTLLESSGTAFTEPGDPVALHIFKVGGPDLYRGELKIIPAENPLSELVTFQHTADLAGRTDEYEYEWKIAPPVDGFPPLIDPDMSRYQSLTAIQVGLPRYTLGGAGVQALGDNYVVMRYRPIIPSHPLYIASPTDADWSRWTQPALAEGWIKRVLAGINPFNQRVNDLFNNRVNTDVSIITQAGRRWEGDVALNQDSINDYGLIEIYETVLRRGRSLSIESGYNYGPANDALLLAAGYLNDLYMFLGNEAWADAANPTIGIGTADNTYGDIATALFSFKGQVPSLLEEELMLLRGRDDFFQPGVEITPVYNRLVWNYTRGIDAGEVIYALNYNILENPNQSPDGVIDAEDAARMFPQGHGDAYGHYLTALKGYYSLLMNSKFDWVPRIEAVNVLGQPVSVDYQDERKFTAAAAAVARAGRQVFDLTWRKDYRPVHRDGWSHMAPKRENTQRQVASTRQWGMDHWASRTFQGAYMNWVVGNSMLPDVDPNPNHEGIQKVDRTTVPELKELATLAAGLQTALDNAEAGLSPLGVPQGALAMDINPNTVIGPDGGTHFEQIYDRTIVALNNAVAAFDDAKDVTRLMRSEQDSLVKLQTRVAEQELAYRNSLIELYGTPYPDDMGAGKTWKQDYDGPDTIHFMYVELPEIPFPSLWNYPGDTNVTVPFKIDVTDLPSPWGTNVTYTDLTSTNWNRDDSNYAAAYTNEAYYIEYHLGPHGFNDKPPTWTSRRASPGKIQEAISKRIAAHRQLSQALWDQVATKATLDRNISLLKAEIDTRDEIRGINEFLLIGQTALKAIQIGSEISQKFVDSTVQKISTTADATADGLPKGTIVGTASGGDLTAPARQAITTAGFAISEGIKKANLARFTIVKLLEAASEKTRLFREFYDIAPLAKDMELRASMAEIGSQFEDMQEQLWGINLRLREYEDAQRNYRARLAEANRVLEEREIFRQRAAALVQGYRTRDAAFRLFRNEKLERYKTLFDLAARYSLLAANAYDYETGLLDTSAGRDFIGRIINSRALGVIQKGEPQFAGSNTGDPGLSSALAEMKADWEVLRGRLGFNNPDAYGTTVSLRTEHFRILPDASGSNNWQQVLQVARQRDILEDADVRRYCMQISNGDGLPVPGLIFTFSTTITDGYNLFGRQLAGGDHAFSPSSFATKIFGVGAALEGYRGMDNPPANGGAISSGGGTSPGDPDLTFLDPLALSATPYIYLIPVGVDSMRSPPLGDASEIRSWTVDDIAIPMPFNIGASDFSTANLYQSSDSLTEPLFTIRKHQAFRPVSTTSVFDPSLYGPNGTLLRSQFTNNRLVGRSVWNSQWKLVIPGKTLLNDPDEGLERFLHTVSDIKLHFVTYSYAGN